VSLCRALGAEIVIAVDVNASTPAAPHTHLQSPSTSHDIVPLRRPWLARLEGLLRLDTAAQVTEEEGPAPHDSRVVSASLDIMQDRITRSRLASDPPDLLLTPEVANVDPLEFTAGESIIDEGCGAVERMLPELRRLMSRP